MRHFIELIKSPSFLEKLLLLLITAMLSGILVPEIAGRLSENRFRKQKIFEAELTLQHDILSAQSELLKNLSQLLWQFQLMNIDVSFYKMNGNDKGYIKSVEIYQREAAGILGKIRAELSTSKRLVSPLMQKKLSQLYFRTLLPIDSNLEQLIQGNANPQIEEWAHQHKASFEVAQMQIENVLSELASALKLSVSSTKEESI